MSTIAWIGLGNMGGPMTANLVRAGHTVKGFDLNPAALAEAAAHGVTAAASLAEAVADADAVFTMLPKAANVRSVYQDSGGIWDTAPKSALLVDSSTVDVATSRYCHERSVELGFGFVDAPVSGGVSGAAAGSLTFMLGGGDQAVGRAAALVEPMSGNVFAVGGPGAGVAAKLANNMMLFISMLAASEGSQLAKAMGLDPKVFWDVITVSSADSWAVRTWYPVPGLTRTAASNNGFRPGFTTDLALKDVSLALEAGRAAGLRLPAADLAKQELEELIGQGLGAMDCTLVAKLVNPSAELDGYPSAGAGAARSATGAASPTDRAASCSDVTVEA
ncbi:MAG: 3-hydroxyisobutyrate dehydrogenase [Bifidobacteriaceae bacterium]|jgi:3-hydroxyisobutyrate dehydrogenase|nr:3-hydroxyisobutyrate dehydrogenase [Bifidobacteriaceae bacterium]